MALTFRKFETLALRQKITRAILLSSGLLLLMVFVVFSLYELYRFDQSLTLNTSSLAKMASVNSTAALAFGDLESAQQNLEALQISPAVVAATLYDRDGNVMGHFSLVGEEPANFESVVLRKGTFKSHGNLVHIEPVEEKGLKLGTLRVEATRSALWTRLWLYATIMLVVGIIGLVLTLRLASMLRKRITEPVDKLVKVTRDISHTGNYSLRVHVNEQDEIGEIAGSINQMLDTIERHIAEKAEAADEVRRLNATLEQRVVRRTALLEEANRELEAFSYSVSHDLRAPVRHIQGYADMLARATDGQLEEKPQRFLRIIRDAASDMGQLIDDLLSFSRMGRAEMNARVVDLGELVRGVQQQVDEAEQSHEIEWRIDPLPSIQADPAMIRVVLHNLIGNAGKYTRHMPKAQIHIGCSEVSDGWMTLFVRDNGAGFDMKYYDKLFGVFQRLHRADEFEGTGIGLATVRRIILRHGGRVWAESAPGQGATFYLTLHVNPEADSNP